MSRSDDLRMQDILDAADQIVDVVADGREIWAKDRLRQLAVERLLEIIGESANALSHEFRAQYPRVPWSDIIGLRVVLAHHYHRVDPNQGVSLSGDDADAPRRYRGKLSDGGTVTMAMEKQPWGDEFGMCTDKFGVPWLVNISQQQA